MKLLSFTTIQRLSTKKCRLVLGGNFIHTEAELLFTVRIVLRKSGLVDSSIPYGWVNGPWKASDPLNGLSLKTKSLMITIGKVNRKGGNQVHWFQFPSIAHPPCWATFLPCPPNQDFSPKKRYYGAVGWRLTLYKPWKREVYHESVSGREVFSGLPQDELGKNTRSGTTNTF